MKYFTGFVSDLYFILPYESEPTRGTERRFFAFT
jgi:hypothetical protein